MKKLSFIVPVYNVSTYLECCVNSLLNQDVPRSEYEIILVDDGSTDESGVIADEFAKKYSNIYTYHKENGGLSDARNFGIEKANGEYIWFVDSDDSIAENCLGNLLEFATKHNSDYVDFSFFFCMGNKKTIGNKKEVKEKLNNQYLYLSNANIYFSAWCFISKRSIWKENNIYFTKGIIDEDFESVLRLLQYCNKCNYYSIESGLYLYNVSRPGSITENKTLEKERFFINSWFVIISILYSYKWNDKDYEKCIVEYIGYAKYKLIKFIVYSKLPFLEKKQYIRLMDNEVGFPKYKPIMYPHPLFKYTWRLFKNKRIILVIGYLLSQERVFITLKKLNIMFKKIMACKMK